MNDITNLSDTILAKSDRLNAEDLLAGSLTITVTNVVRYKASNGDNAFYLNYHNDGGRPFYPCKTMRKVITTGWGEDGNAYIGRSMVLFCEHTVKWGGTAVGGVRISHLSHIQKRLILSLSETRGKKKQHTINILQENYYPDEVFNNNFDAMAASIASGKYTVAQIITKCSAKGTLTDGQLNALNSLGASNEQVKGFTPAAEPAYVEQAAYQPAEEFKGGEF
jgi:hypothetical protein